MKYSAQLLMAGLLFLNACDLMDETSNDEKDVNTCIELTADDSGATIKNTSDSDILVNYILVDANISCKNTNDKEIITKSTIRKELDSEDTVIKAGKTIVIDYQQEVTNASTSSKTDEYVCTTSGTSGYKAVGRCPYKKLVTNSNTETNQTTDTQATSATTNKSSLPVKPLTRPSSLRQEF